MSPCPSREQLRRLLAEQLADAELRAVETHVETCPACQQTLARLSDEDAGIDYDKLRSSEPLSLPQDHADGVRRPEETAFFGEPALAAASEPAPILFPGPPTDKGPLGQLDSLHIRREVGRGRFGVVYEAVDELDRVVAVKVLKPQLTGDPRERTRLEQEARKAAAVRHDHIVTVHRMGLAPGLGLPYLVMEYLEGETLAARLRRQGVLAPKEVAEVVRQVALGLAAAHARRLVHRDVKPSNILLEAGSGRAKLTDFGLARATELGSVASQSGAVVGTPAYMSPEQVTAPGEVDGRSDVYGLGVVLYEALTGERPFRGLPHLVLDQVVHDEPRAPRNLNDAVPRDLETIVLKAMAKEPERRYASAEALAEDLRCFLTDRPIQARRSSLWEHFWRWHRRNRVVGNLLFSLAALVLLIAGGVGWVIRDRAAREAALAEEVNRGLDEAARRIDEGKWPEAGAAVQRTEELLVAAGRREFPPRLLQLQEDVTMARRLEDIYSQPEKHEFHTGQEQDAKYARAFQEYGIDLAVLTVEEAAERIWARSIRLELARGLDVWSAMRRRADNRGSPDWKQLLKVAMVADPDPWRNQLREALARDDRETLKGLAAAADVRHLPPATLALLGRTLADYLEAPEQAVALLRRAQRQYPGDLWINDALGWYCWGALRPPQHDESARFYTAARAGRPDSPYLTYSIARALRERGSHAEAIAEYSRAIELNPDYLWAWCARGRAYGELGQWDKALADQSKAIALDPKYATAWNERAHAYGELGQWDKALADLSKAIEVAPKFAIAWNNRGYAYGKLGVWEKALADHSKAIELDPKFTFAWHNRGHAYRELGQWDKELADFSRAIELDPRNANAWHSRGYTYGKLGQWDKALADFSRSVELTPTYAVAWYNRGRAYTELRQWRKALTDHSKAIELDPKFAFAWHKRGHAYRELGQWQKALADYSRAIELDSKLAIAWYGRGYVYNLLGQSDKALADYSRAIELDPRNAIAWFYRCNAYGELGQWNQALADWSKAIELDPRYAIAWNDRGYVYNVLRQWDKAASEGMESAPLNETQFRSACLRLLQGNTPAYQQLCKQLALRRQRAADFPAVPQYQNELAAILKNLGLLWQATGRFQEAETAYREASAIWKPLTADFPTVPAYRQDLAGAVSNLGRLLQANGRSQEAEAAYREASALRHQLAADFPTAPDYQNELAEVMVDLAGLARQRRDLAQARRLLEQAHPYHRAALKANERHPAYRKSFHDNWGELTQILVDLGDHAAAAAAAGELCHVACDAVGDNYAAALILGRCLPLAEKDLELSATKRRELAQSYAGQALTLLREAIAKGYQDAEQLKQAPEFEPLRARAEFQELLTTLAEKGKKTTP
jgi:tetratricopeptide (TPR) repeat protein